MARIGGFSGGSNNQVFLNVYDLHENNDMLYPWGLGFYHSGVQIGREEYTFGKIIQWHSQCDHLLTHSLSFLSLSLLLASSAGIFTHNPKVF